MADQASPDIDPADVANGTHALATDAVSNATPDVAGSDAAGPASADPSEDGLLGELARAMHLAASSQYERMNAELERRRVAQVEAIAARAGAEVEELKAGSESDIGAIDAWSKTEIEKIKLERLRRIDARREELAGQLERHETVRAREVAAVESAVDAHRTEIDLFFGRMERETDPAAIARVASTLPAFPPLDEIAEVARREAADEPAATATSAGFAMAEPAATGEPVATESITAQAGEAPSGDVADEPGAEPDPAATVSATRLMAVMAPDASLEPEDARPWEAPYAVSVAAGSGAQESPAEPPAPTRVGSTLLRTVRAIRPMGGERHDRSGGDR